MTKALKFIAWIILICGFVLAVGFFVFIGKHNIILTPEKETPDFDITGSIGDYVGGVIGTFFSLVSAILVIVTLQEQEKQYKRDRFIQSFYEMLHLHRDNVSNLVYTKHDQENITGREVFSVLVREYSRAFSLIHLYCDNVYNNTIEKDVKDYLSDNTKRAKLEMRIAYGYFFFGSDHFSLSAPSPSEMIIETEVVRLLHFNNYTISSHNILLGHYYRHLFQIITMLMRAEMLNESDKYSYSKQLRAQLNDDEQLLLYYNAMSDVGKNWLIADDSKINKIIPFYNKVKLMCPMARFRMIKNIPFNKDIVGLSPLEQFSNEIRYFNRKEIHFLKT